MRALIPAATVAIVLLSSSACTPCLGVVDCEQSPTRSVSGQVLDGQNGAAAADVVVRLVARYASGADSVTSVTDRHGLYELTLPPRTDSLRLLSLRVLPPDLPGYTVDSLQCQALTIRGDGCVLEPILKAPRLSGLMQFRFRQALDVAVAGVTITFQQTGGSDVLGGATPARFTGSTDIDGNVQFFGDAELYATSMAPMVGDLTVELPPPFTTIVHSGFKITPRYRFADRGLMLTLTGPNLAYTVQFEDSSTAAPLRSVEVSLTRVGGIQISPTAVTAASNDSGTVFLGARPLATGTVVADLAIVVRGRTTAIRGVPFPTFDADSLRTYARFRVGPTGILYSK